MAEKTKKKKTSSPPELDEGARGRLDTELRNALSGRDPDFAAAVLTRVAGVKATPERRNVEISFQLATAALADEAGLLRRVDSADDLSRAVLALLASQPWWTRTALVQALALIHGVGDLGAGLADVLQKWPVLVRTNALTRSEELTLFEPLAMRLRSHLAPLLSVSRMAGEPRSAVGLGRTLLSLALFPALVAQRRPRVTRSRELHGADATKLERALGEARGLFATWERLAAFEEVDGALAPMAARVRKLLDDPGGLVRELLEQRLGEVGFALARLAAAADPNDVLDLGASLLAIGMQAKFAFGFDVPSLASRVERDDLRFAPLLQIDAARNTLAIAPDVRSAIRGEPLATGPAATGFVQPNYEVVLPPGVPLGAAFIVACAAELVHFEAVARMKITRESVLAARSVGIGVEDLLEALDTLSGPRSVPPGVKHAIEEWGSSVGEARIRTAVLLDLRAAGPLLDKVAEKLAPLTLDRPAPHLFVLSRAPNPRELAHLRAAGVVTRTVAAAAAKGDVVVEESEARKVEDWALSDGKLVPRDLRYDLDPHRVMTIVESSRPVKKGGPSSPPTSTRGAFDPDDQADRPLPPAVEAALEERRGAWSERKDWIVELGRVAASPSFRRGAATNPGALALAIRRTSDPQRLSLEVARLVAEASVRRVAD